MEKTPESVIQELILEGKEEETVDFLFKFYMLGYDWAIRSLQINRPFTEEGKSKAFRKYFKECVNADK